MLCFYAEGNEGYVQHRGNECIYRKRVSFSVWKEPFPLPEQNLIWISSVQNYDEPVLKNV